MYAGSREAAIKCQKTSRSGIFCGFLTAYAFVCNLKIILTYRTSCFPFFTSHITPAKETFVCLSVGNFIYKKLTRRWDSERELSLRRHCTRTKNTIDTCINCATDRFLQRKFTKFSEKTQCNRHYAVQGHSRSPILVPIESSYTTSY